MGIENVPRPPGIAQPKNPTPFPALMWDAETGESKVFARAGDVPAGWLNHHPDDKDPAKQPPAPIAEKPPVLPMTRKEVVQALKDGGIEFAANAPHAALYDLLLIGVKSALTEAQITFDPESTDAKALLGLFPAS